jgi:hypothetical protein
MDAMSKQRPKSQFCELGEDEKRHDGVFHPASEPIMTRVE